MVGPPISLKGENVVNCDEEGEVIITDHGSSWFNQSNMKSGQDPDYYSQTKLLPNFFSNLTVYTMTESSKHLLFVEISPKSRAFHSIC